MTKTPRIIVSRLMRRGWCLNLFGTLWVRDRKYLSPVLVNHELIHTAQQKEMLYVPFYVWYGIEWLVRFLLTMDAGRAYRSILFEREAYANGSYPDYLGHRRRFTWLRRRPRG